MDVEAGTAWIRFDTDTPGEMDRTGPTKTHDCERVVELAKVAISRLGW